MISAWPLARRLLEQGTAAGEVARMFKVHRATLYRTLNTSRDDDERRP
jgi:DNA invertase Pin-like site-specific DNA recombinase